MIKFITIISACFILSLPFSGLGLDLFHEKIPFVLLETTRGVKQGTATYFVLHYRIAYSAAGIARFPDGGTSRTALDKYYLFMYDDKVKKDINSGEIKITPGLQKISFYDLEKSKNDIYISLSYYEKAQILILKNSIFQYSLESKKFTNIIENGYNPQVSPDTRSFLFKRTMDGYTNVQLCVYDLKSKRTEILNEKPLNMLDCEWRDNENVLFSVRGKVFLYNLNRKTGSVTPTSLEKKKYTMNKGKYVTITDTGKHFENLVFYKESGLEDPLTFINGSRSDKALSKIVLEYKGNRNLRLAIIGKFIKEKKFKVLDSIIRDYSKYNTSLNKYYRDEEKAIIMRIINQNKK